MMLDPKFQRKQSDQQDCIERLCRLGVWTLFPPCVQADILHGNLLLVVDQSFGFVNFYLVPPTKRTLKELYGLS